MPPCCSHRHNPTTQETTSNFCASNTFIIYVFNYISIPTSMCKTEKCKHTLPKNYPCFSCSSNCVLEKEVTPLGQSGIIPTELRVSQSGKPFPLLKMNMLQKKLLKLCKAGDSASAIVFTEQLGADKSIRDSVMSQK